MAGSAAAWVDLELANTPWYGPDGPTQPLNGEGDLEVQALLFPHHVAFLAGKGIPPRLAIEGGVVSLGEGDEAALVNAGFSDWQIDHMTFPGVLIAIYGLDGKIHLHQYRPDHPFPGRPKYETPKGKQLAIYVHPRSSPLLRDPTERRYFTESPIKAMSLTARGLAALGSMGQYGWKHDGRPLPELDLLAWEQNVVELFPDSDVATNDHVFQGQRELRDALKQRGTNVTCHLIPDVEGRNQGVDDFLGRDGDEDDLLATPVFDFAATHPASPDYQRALERERIRQSATEAVRLERAVIGWTPPEGTVDLEEELAIREQAQRHVIEGWQLEGHNITLVSEFKAGKTTLFDHLMKCLADGEPFLGVHDVRLRGRIAFWNYELTPQQYRAWLREIGVKHQERVTVLHLRGQRLPLTTPEGEAWAVAWLQAHKIEYLIVDTYARAMADCGLDENSNRDVELFVRALDLMKQKAGVASLALSAHTGRAEQEPGREHARGGTRIDDWADVRWILTQQDDIRFISAVGRDINQPERQLIYDSVDRSLRLGEGSRKQARLDADVGRVCGAAAANPGIQTNALVAAMGMNRERATIAIQAAERRGEIRREVDGKAYKHYFIPPEKLKRIGS